jgi:hypothetical protein
MAYFPSLRLALHPVIILYTRDYADVRISLVKSHHYRIAVAFLGGLSALGVSGCWAAAVQFIPPAIEAAGAMGTSAISWAESEKAPSLGVIELRESPGGTPEYRELRVAGNSDDEEERWTPVVDDGTNADGWRPAEHFLQMSFTPPLQMAFPENGSTYLAYAAADAESQDGQNMLLAFKVDFGPPVGTFVSDGHTYNYSLPRTLPSPASSGEQSAAAFD